MRIHTTKLVTIMRTGNSVRVDPEFILVVPKGKLTIRNRTKHTAHAQIYKMNKTFVIPSGKPYPLTIPKVKPGIYPFAVFCNSAGVFSWTGSTNSTMSSMPIIIVPKL